MSSLIAYAMDFASFLLEKLGKETSNIDEIILFGSVARGESSAKSDVDIFVDSSSDERRLEKLVEKITEDFYKSIKFGKYWKLLGIENDINCIVGRLEKWKSIKRSVLSDGILLYGKYRGFVEKGKLYAVLSWKPIKPESKRVVFNKKMFGYKQRDKPYKGLVQMFFGEKLDNAVIVPLEHANNLIGVFRKMGITVKIRNLAEF